jgi:heme oxygenase
LSQTDLDITAPPISARFALRSATADAHARLDALFSSFDLADPADYGRFLQAQAGAFAPMEAALDAAGVTAIVPDWPDRRRSHALSADLSGLGLTEPAPVAVPVLTTEAAILGALYVLEGSRLGGALLVRTVPDGLPKTFLTPGNPAAWRAFVTLLDERLSSSTALEQASGAAASAFQAFASSASQILEPTGRD